MVKLWIKRGTLSELSSFCTPVLLIKVFKGLGENNIVIDETDKNEDIWNVDTFLKTYHIELLDRLKVVFVFYYLGGQLKYNNETIPYEILFRILNCNEPNVVLRYWLHNLYNDIIPTFDVGELVIPKVMPRYVPLKMSENKYVIEKWQKGQYVQMPEVFLSEKSCKAKCQELEEENNKRWDIHTIS